MSLAPFFIQTAQPATLEVAQIAPHRGSLAEVLAAACLTTSGTSPLQRPVPVVSDTARLARTPLPARPATPTSTWNLPTPNACLESKTATSLALAAFASSAIRTTFQTVAEAASFVTPEPFGWRISPAALAIPADARSA